MGKDRPDIALALALGWYYDGTSGSGHRVYRHPGNRAKVLLASSPNGNPRPLRNAMVRIRRLTPGLDSKP